MHRNLGVLIKVLYNENISVTGPGVGNIVDTLKYCGEE
jgi:hypothetical protein